jgi:hypothetical protein
MIPPEVKVKNMLLIQNLRAMALKSRGEAALPAISGTPQPLYYVKIAANRLNSLIVISFIQEIFL